ncbi:MAG: hypothetical protein AAF098_19295 [Pseudomonadota bacterium]
MGLKRERIAVAYRQHSFGRRSLLLASPAVLSALLGIGAITGCSGYRMQNLAKSDVNQIADEFIAETQAITFELMRKMYARNPNQLALGEVNTVDARLRQLRESPGSLSFRELQDLQELKAMDACFEERYHGDRVFVLIVGLLGMLRHSYGYNREFFLFDKFEPEVLATSARNIEILLWRLKNNRRSNGSPFLITSEYQGEIDNLSFERLFGKLIALQDMAATIAAGAGNRIVTKAVHTATSVFIPLPL